MPARTRQNEEQLASMAGAIDRANRPVSLLFFPALLLLAAIVYVGWAGLQVRSASRTLSVRRSMSAQIESLAGEIRQQRTKQVNLASYFPPQPYFVSTIQDTANSEKFEHFARPPVFERERTFVESADPPLERAEFGATIQLENLDAVFKWIDTVLNAEPLKGKVFVSYIRLQPISNGWGGTVRFSVYRPPTGARR